MTYLNEIYDNFMGTVSDYNLVFSTNPDDLIEELFGYLKSSVSKFIECRQSLEILIDDNEEKYFESTLTAFEIEILTNLMIAEYLRPKFISGEILRPNMSDKSFKIFSQANHLREMSLLYRMIKAETNKMIIRYTYLKLGEGKYGK